MINKIKNLINSAKRTLSLEKEAMAVSLAEEITEKFMSHEFVKIGFPEGSTDRYQLHATFCNACFIVLSGEKSWLGMLGKYHEMRNQIRIGSVLFDNLLEDFSD